MLNISKRLKIIAGLVPVGSAVADIGADHGYLSVYLVNNNISVKVYACDINLLPLENAKRTASEYLKYTDRMELRLCDGLSGIKKGETDAAVIAGMGAQVICGIIDRCEFVKDKNYTLILQPMTSPEILRKYLTENGFCIQTEIAICENRKLYSIIKAKFDGEKRTVPESFYYIGRLDMREDVSAQYIKKQYMRFKKCAQSLENNEKETELYMYYKKIADEIGAAAGFDC